MSDPTARLDEQLSLQDRRDRARMTVWIPGLFALGLAVSAAGLYASWRARAPGRVLDGSVVIFGVFTLLFGLAVAAWLSGPLRVRPRIVPYFARELEPLGGSTTAAFRRGRSIYIALAQLDALARELGVTPLSSFGFADDWYGQQVTWHPAADGLRTAEALRARVAERSPSSAELHEELEVLGRVLAIAAERSVPFALVLRLHPGESTQAAATLERRAGRLW